MYIAQLPINYYEFSKSPYNFVLFLRNYTLAKSAKNFLDHPVYTHIYVVSSHALFRSLSKRDNTNKAV